MENKRKIKVEVDLGLLGVVLDILGFLALVYILQHWDTIWAVVNTGH